jgi:hypothetical protein
MIGGRGEMSATPSAANFRSCRKLKQQESSMAGSKKKAPKKKSMKK